jgi:hypothetical protein
MAMGEKIPPNEGSRRKRSATRRGPDDLLALSFEETLWCTSRESRAPTPCVNHFDEDGKAHAEEWKLSDLRAPYSIQYLSM